MNKSPEKLLSRRKKEFIKDVRVRNSLGISLSCFRLILFTIFILILMALFLYFLDRGYVEVLWQNVLTYL